MDTGVKLLTDAGARKNPQKDLEGDLMPSENEVFESEEATERETKMSEKEKDRRGEKKMQVGRCGRTRVLME
jgi:hypothetical protein